MADKQFEVHVPLQDIANGATWARYAMKKYLIREEGIDPMTDIRFGSVVNAPDGLVTYDLVRGIEGHKMFKAECGGPVYEFERLDDGTECNWSGSTDTPRILDGTEPCIIYKFVARRKSLTTEE